MYHSGPVLGSWQIPTSRPDVKHGVPEGDLPDGGNAGRTCRRQACSFGPSGYRTIRDRRHLHTAPIAVTGAFRAGAAKDEQNRRPCGQDYLAWALSRPAGLVEGNLHIGSAVERTRQSRPISQGAHSRCHVCQLQRVDLDRYEHTETKIARGIGSGFVATIVRSVIMLIKQGVGATLLGA